MVLVVEDEAVLQMEMQLELEGRRGLDLTCGFRPEQAYAVLSESPVTVPCIDIMLSGKPMGLDIARRCEAHTVPYVFVSGSTDPTTLEAVTSLRPLAFLTKPVDYDHLANLIRRAASA